MGSSKENRYNSQAKKFEKKYEKLAEKFARLAEKEKEAVSEEQVQKVKTERAHLHVKQVKLQIAVTRRKNFSESEYSETFGRLAEKIGELGKKEAPTEETEEKPE